MRGTIAALVFGAGLLVVTSSGCGAKKVNECNALVTVINKGVADLDKGTKATENKEGDGAAELNALATSMDKIAEDASKVELTIPELKKYSSDYQSMAKEVARSARDMATATTAKDLNKVSTANAAMEKAAKLEDPIIESLNKFCQGE